MTSSKHVFNLYSELKLRVGYSRHDDDVADVYDVVKALMPALPLNANSDGKICSSLAGAVNFITAYILESKLLQQSLKGG